MSGIFISYRRDDTGGYAGRLDDDLRGRFGADRIFRDLENIEPGVDFVEALERAIGSCSALIALIGRHWLATDLPGRRRLADEDDFVVQEIRKALDQNILVIPVLVGGATMPSGADLPPALRRLSRLNALEISDSRWRFDVERLIARLEASMAGPDDAGEGVDRLERAPVDPLPPSPPPAQPSRRAIGRTGWAIAAAAVTLVLVLVAAALVPRSDKGPGPPSRVDFWVQWEDRELAELEKVVDGFRRDHPGVEVNLRGGVDEAILTKEVKAGRGPDLAANSGIDKLGKFCTSGDYQDLGSAVAQKRIDPAVFQPLAWQAVTFEGRHCALPYMADTVGLYYNRSLFEGDGIPAPPRTASELTTMAKKLTKFNPDGSIRVAGFIPLLHTGVPGAVGYGQNYINRFVATFGATFLDARNRATLTSAAWIDFFNWQRQLVDFYGYDKLVAFVSGLPHDALERGQVAMELDGEWRAGEKPDFDYGIAPFPVSDLRADLYGASDVTVGLIVLPRGSRNPELALDLARYLATEPGPVLRFAKAIRNIPTTRDSVEDLLLEGDAAYLPFLQAFKHRLSTSPPVLRAGPEPYYAPVLEFLTRWQQGDAIDLRTGLREVNDEIAKALPKS